MWKWEVGKNLHFNWKTGMKKELSGLHLIFLDLLYTQKKKCIYNRYLVNVVLRNLITINALLFFVFNSFWNREKSGWCWMIVNFQENSIKIHYTLEYLRIKFSLSFHSLTVKINWLEVLWHHIHQQRVKMLEK